MIGEPVLPYGVKSILILKFPLAFLILLLKLVTQ